MFVKVTNGQASKYPYTLGELRRENPNISFPKVIPDGTLAEYGVYTVEPSTAPKFDNRTHLLLETVENIDGVWTQQWVQKELPTDRASANVRRHRDQLLAETDWIVIKSYERGENIPAQWELYRQALRDITAQAGFPYSVVWPTKPE